jgi:hypothetical protein
VDGAGELESWVQAARQKPAVTIATQPSLSNGVSFTAAGPEAITRISL